MQILELSSCIKPGVLRSLECLKNSISDIAKNPYSSFFSIIQEQQDQNNSGIYPVLAEINQYAQISDYNNSGNDSSKDKILDFKLNLMEPLNLNGERISSGKIVKDNKDMEAGKRLQNEMNNYDWNQIEQSDRVMSVENQKSSEQSWNGYEEEDQENEEQGYINTPGFTSQHNSPSSKRIISEKCTNKLLSTQQNDYFTQSQILFQGSPLQSTLSVSPEYSSGVGVTGIFRNQKNNRINKKKFCVEDDIEEEYIKINSSNTNINNNNNNNNSRVVFSNQSNNSTCFQANPITINPPPALTLKKFASNSFQTFNNSHPFTLQSEQNLVNQFNSCIKTNQNMNINKPFGFQDADQEGYQNKPFQIFDTLNSQPKSYSHKISFEDTNDKQIFSGKSSKNQKETNQQLPQQSLNISESILKVDTSQKPKSNKKIDFNIPQSHRNEIEQEESQQKIQFFNNRKGSFCCVQNDEEEEADIEEEATSQLNSCYQLIDSPFSKCQHEVKPSYNNLDSIPQQALLAGQYKSIGKHLERLQKFVEKIQKNNHNPHKYIFNSQHSQCLERVKRCLDKEKKMSIQPLISTCLYVIQFQLLQNKFNIHSKDMQKQKQLAFRSQKSYQKAFMKLDVNFSVTLDYISHFERPNESLRQYLVEIYEDCKQMALPQSYHQLVQYISNLINLVNHFFIMISSSSSQTSNLLSAREQNSKSKIQRHISLPNNTTLLKSQSQFANYQPTKQFKRSQSNTHLNQLVLSQNAIGGTSTAAESEFKQDQSTRNLNSLSNLGYNDSFDIESSKNNFHSFNNQQFQYSSQQQMENNKTNKDNNENNQTINQIQQNLFQITITSPSPNQVFTSNTLYLDNKKTTNLNPFFGSSKIEDENNEENDEVNLRSDSSSIQSSHFNQLVDHNDSPPQTNKNLNPFVNIINSNPLNFKQLEETNQNFNKNNETVNNNNYNINNDDSLGFSGLDLSSNMSTKPSNFASISQQQLNFIQNQSFSNIKTECVRQVFMLPTFQNESQIQNKTSENFQNLSEHKNHQHFD